MDTCMHTLDTSHTLYPIAPSLRKFQEVDLPEGKKGAGYSQE